MESKDNAGEHAAKTMRQLAAAGLGAALLLDALSSRSALCSAIKAMAGGASLYWAAHAAVAPVDPLADLAPDQLVELGRS